MAQPDGDSQRFPGFPLHQEPDNWLDAQTEQPDDVEAYDELDQRFLRTLGTPSYDLGPSTDSFVVDLTVSAPAAPQPLDLGYYSDTDSSGTGSSDTDSSDTDSAEQASEQLSQSRHAAPAFAPDLPAAAQPAAAQPAATAAPPADSVAPQPAGSPWGIPPVPTGPVLSGAESLTAASILKTRKARPQSGWRKGLFNLTSGRINLGLSRSDVHRADQIARARTAVSGCHRLAVISLKGGVGKTTTTAALGAMFADLRGDRVIAVDANPDRGTLAERVPRENGATVRHLLDAGDQLRRYADVREFTSQSPTRLEVLASDSDPRVSDALSEQDYRDTITTLERFYNLVLTDCGTGLLHDAMRGILGLASSLVVVSSASLDGARSASATLDWLEAHGFDDLAKNAVVVISSVRPSGGIVDVMQLEDHFASRCRDVVTIPYDPHLEAGGVLDLADLDIATLYSYRELAAAVGEAFVTRR